MTLRILPMPKREKYIVDCKPHKPRKPAFCTCKNEYGHQWNASNTRLICAKCKKFV